MNIESLLLESDPALEVRIPEPSLLYARMISGSSTVESATRTSSLHQSAVWRLVSMRYGQIKRPAVLALFAVLVAAAIGVPLTIGRTSPSFTNTTPGVSTPTPGVWSLAGYISQSGWQLNSASGPLPTTQQFTTQLTCPTSSTCYSSGTYIKNVHENSQSVISVTHDGGASWQQSLAPGDGTYFYGFSCPTANTCMVVGDVPNTKTQPFLYTTTDGGESWASLPMPGLDELPISLSCATTLECATIGLMQTSPAPTPVAYFTVNGGQSWTASALPPSFFPSENAQSALDCFPDGHCVAAGTSSFGSFAGQGTASMIYSDNVGATWASATVPSMPGTGLMSCSDDIHCVSIESDNNHNGYVVASGELVTSDGGLTWSAIPATGLESPSAPVPMSIDSISCPTDADCWASAHLIESECNGSCPYVPDQAVMLATSNEGLTWTDEPLPTPPSASLQYGGVWPVDCVGDINCRAVGILELTKSASDAGMPSVQQDVVLTLVGGTTSDVNGAPGSTAVAG
jgi:photosystem II stability/assembly factor-like uncharacterized protein